MDKKAEDKFIIEELAAKLKGTIEARLCTFLAPTIPFVMLCYYLLAPNEQLTWESSALLGLATLFLGFTTVNICKMRRDGDRADYWKKRGSEGASDLQATAAFIWLNIGVGSLAAAILALKLWYTTTDCIFIANCNVMLVVNLVLASKATRDAKEADQILRKRDS